ncbi:MAG: hypothetical protein JKY50_01625 [Oleispira sp.]|nr:hypothetical protein [Oleispira sp.]
MFALAVLIPGFVPCTNGLPPTQVTDMDCQQWLKRQYDQGALLGGSCSGAFVLSKPALSQGQCGMGKCLGARWPNYYLGWAVILGRY